MIWNLFNFHHHIFIINSNVVVKKRKAVSKKPSKSFFQEYNFEITVILLLGFGIFLLVEDLEIKHYIATFIRSVLFGIINVFGVFRDKIIHTVKKIEFSDFVGIAFILLALYLITNRWRERMILRYSSALECPNCDKKLHRIHKTTNQMLLSFMFFLKVKNYKCSICSYKTVRLEKYN